MRVLSRRLLKDGKKLVTSRVKLGPGSRRQYHAQWQRRRVNDRYEGSLRKGESLDLNRLKGELVADPAGIGFGFGGVDPGTLHSHGQLHGQRMRWSNARHRTRALAVNRLASASSAYTRSFGEAERVPGPRARVGRRSTQGALLDRLGRAVLSARALASAGDATPWLALLAPRRACACARALVQITARSHSRHGRGERGRWVRVQAAHS
jgi:hypothetical protein